MNKYLKTKDRNILKGIAYYQIIGGIIGIGLILYAIFGGIEIKISNLVILILATGLYIFSIISGMYLRQENWEKGIKLTTINQILQSIQFSILGYTFIYVSLINIYVGLDYTNELLLKFDFSLTNFLFTLTQKNEVITVGINLFAIFLLYYIEKLKQRIKQEKELLEAGNDLTIE